MNLSSLLDKPNTMKKFNASLKWKLMNRNKMGSNQWSVTSTPDIAPRRILFSVTDLNLLNVVSKEESFLEDKSRESQSPEPSLENQRFFSLMRLLPLWTKIPKPKYLLPSMLP